MLPISSKKKEGHKPSKYHYIYLKKSLVNLKLSTDYFATVVSKTLENKCKIGRPGWRQQDAKAELAKLEQS